MRAGIRFRAVSAARRWRTVGFLCVLLLGIPGCVRSPEPRLGSVGPAEPLTAERLVESVLRAMRPAATMRATVTDQLLVPYGATFTKPKPGEPLPRTTTESTAILSGVRSRIERYYYEHTDERFDESSLVYYDVAVFDGTAYRELTTKVQGEGKRRHEGSQSTRNGNASHFAEDFYGLPFDLADSGIMDKLELTVAQGESEGLYILEARHKDAGSASNYRLTVDGGKGWNVVKAERLFNSGRKDYEVDITLQKLAGGLWYPAERTVTKYSWFHGGKPIVTNRVTVDEVALDIAVPEGILSLEFPAGTRVWDTAAGDWFTAGESQDAVE